MGRPLNKKFFSGLMQSGFQIGCTAHFTGEVGEEAAYIVEQVSNRKYRVESEAGPGTRSEILTMVADPGTLAEGTMAVLVTPDASSGTDGPEYAKIIKAHQVVTWEGNRYAWPVTTGSRAGIFEADLQETTT